MTKIIYYVSSSGDNPVKEFIDSLEKIQKSKIFKIFLLIEEYGLKSVIPHIKKLSGTPFWEMRILGKDNIRIIYLTLVSDSILVLHGFIKKTQKTPEKELNTILKRYNEWK